MTIETTEPTDVVAGDTWTWSRDFADYSAADGWSLAYHFKAADTPGFSASGGEVVASGSSFVVTKAASATATIKAGRYYWQAYATKASERFKVAEGWLTVRPDLAQAGSIDMRSDAQRAVDAIRAYLTDPENLEAQSYTYNGRALSQWPREQLYAELTKWEARLNAEEQAARLQKGLATNRTIRVRF